MFVRSDATADLRILFESLSISADLVARPRPKAELRAPSFPELPGRERYIPRSASFSCASVYFYFFFLRFIGRDFLYIDRFNR